MKMLCRRYRRPDFFNAYIEPQKEFADVVQVFAWRQLRTTKGVEGTAVRMLKRDMEGMEWRLSI